MSLFQVWIIFNINIWKLSKPDSRKTWFLKSGRQRKGIEEAPNDEGHETETKINKEWAAEHNAGGTEEERERKRKRDVEQKDKKQKKEREQKRKKGVDKTRERKRGNRRGRRKRKDRQKRTQ